MELDGCGESSSTPIPMYEKRGSVINDVSVMHWRSSPSGGGR